MRSRNREGFRPLAAGICLVALMAVAAPVGAQQETPRPSSREGPDTTCGPSYGSRPFGDSSGTAVPGTGQPEVRVKPPCPPVNDAVVRPPATAPAGVPVAPLSPKTDSLRQQADSTSRRP